MSETVSAYEDILEENRRLKMIQPVGQKATLFIVAIITLCTLTVIGILGVIIARPNGDNTAIIATVVGITSPILVALLGAAVQQVHLAVNSRLSQLLELTASASRAKGALGEKEKTEASSVVVTDLKPTITPVPSGQGPIKVVEAPVTVIPPEGQP